MIGKLIILVAALIATYLSVTNTDTFEPELVRGKRVLITGASTGIGEQLAYQYARHGASVFITARRENLLQEVIEKCSEIGDPHAKFGYVSADMAIMADTELVVQSAAGTLGGLDHVVLNHAYMPAPKYWDTTAASLNSIDLALRVNTQSYTHLAAHVLPYLEKSQGHLSVVSSLVGKLGMSGFASYSASKFALDGFFSSLRYELKPKNISVTVNVLGYIGTDIISSTIIPSILSDFIVDSDRVNKTVKPADPSECAYEIMRGTTMRETEVYFPPSQYIKYVVYMRDAVSKFELMNILRPKVA